MLHSAREPAGDRTFAFGTGDIRSGDPPPRVDEPPGHALVHGLAGKISRRLAQHVRLEPRRLVNREPLVSFTFDDAPASAHERGAALLEQAGARATYYVSTALLGRRTPHWIVIDRDAIRDLHLRGHEIGLHTHAHRAVGALSAAEFVADFETNRACLADIHPGIAPQNFAYPYGFADFARKRQLSRLALSSRSTQPGVNAGVFDAQFVKGVELADTRLTADELEHCLDAVVARRGWLVFVCHDVGADPSPYGCSNALFALALEGVAARGLRAVTVAEALRQSAPVFAARAPTAWRRAGA